MECDVLIVGGGPVGLVLAMELARRNVQVVVADDKKSGKAATVRCNHVSSRSMEAFRRLGVADAIRDAGLPAEYPHDVAFRTTATGLEFSRIVIPSRAGRQRGETGPDGWWPTPEPPHRINQTFMEPILQAHAHTMPGLTLLHEVRIEAVEQSETGVAATAHTLTDDRTFEIRAGYLAGCDGARSGVRNAIGARLEGDAVVQRVQSSYIRAPGLLERMGAGPAWGIVSLNPRRSGTIYAIDGRETWLLHNYLKPHETDFDAIDRDLCIKEILGVDKDFAYEFVHREDWIGRRLVSTKMREGRVFLAGDAAHIWVPYAGYGMNAGIADAVGLAWLLAARVKGWGGPAMLEAYEAERLPITEQVSQFAMNHAEKMIGSRGAVPDEIEDDTAVGAAARRHFGQRCYDINVDQYCCAGLNFGYYYSNSPIILYGDQSPPPYSMADYSPSSVPGCRAPHLFLPDGRSLYDTFGLGYTLLRFDPEVAVDVLLSEAKRRAIPPNVVDAPHSDLYSHTLALVRPDQHIAWADDALPENLSNFIDRIAGQAPKSGR